jgi:hypothetical protein
MGASVSSSKNPFGQSIAGRPDHPDVNLLSDVVLSIDAETDGRRSQEGADALGRVLNETADSQSVTYVAMQRTMRILGISSPAEMLLRGPQAAAMASLWMDAFAAGARFQKRYGDRERS